MPLALLCLIFIVTAVAASLIGMRAYVRPHDAVERITAAEVAVTVAPRREHSASMRDTLERLGQMLPASAKDRSAVQKRLIRAGIRDENAIRVLYGAKIALGLGLPLLASAVASNIEGSNKTLAIGAALAAGFLGPNEYVNRRAKRRQKHIHRGLANALDLMVVCVESGLGLDQAIMQVAKELDHAHPDIAEEFGIVNLEMRAGKRRAEALRNLADRTGVEDLKKLVAVLVQADRFGTGVAQSLRGHAEYMRVQARQVAEEKAAKLGVKLVFPIFFCILPSLFVVTVGPVAVKIVRELLPMMNNMG